MGTWLLQRNSKFLRSAFAALLIAAAAALNMPGSVAIAQVRPTPTPSPTPTPAPPTPRPLPRGIAPPSLVYPIVRVPTANPPFNFLWTPVSGATQYELQISDRFDVRSHVLLDITVFGTTYTFTNTNLPGSNFTSLQPNGLALPGGTYHWRVRAISGFTSTIFSPIASFTLGTVPGARPLHDLAVANITVADNPTSGIASAILVTVENRGSFAATGAGLLVTVDGRTIASEQVMALGPGESDTIAIPWNPAQSGRASIAAVLDYADDFPAHKLGSFNVAVRAQEAMHGSFGGIIGGTCGAFVLKDEQGNSIALLHAGAPVSAVLAALYAQKSVVTGTYSIGPDGPRIDVVSARTHGSSSNGAPNPCAAAR